MWHGRQCSRSGAAIGKQRKGSQEEEEVEEGEEVELDTRPFLGFDATSSPRS